MRKLTDWLRRKFRRPARTCETCRHQSTMVGSTIQWCNVSILSSSQLKPCDEMRCFWNACGPRGNLWEARS